MRDGFRLAGRYTLQEPLGRGAMGEVWRAVDRRLDRSVAVKVLRERFADPADVERFRREAKITARLQHPGITVVHDVDSDDGQLFIVMELLHGRDLAAVLAEARAGLPVGEAVWLAGQAADALQAAHARGVVHRDLKPANLFLQNDGRLKICDFGIASAADATAHLTTAGKVMGTPAYMSPEQGQGLQVDKRSDLYSLGCVLYALLTGQPPFQGHEYAILYQHVHAAPAAPRTIRPDVPAELDSLVMQLLAKNPASRPPDAGYVATALRMFRRPPAVKVRRAPGEPCRSSNLVRPPANEPAHQATITSPAGRTARTDNKLSGHSAGQGKPIEDIARTPAYILTCDTLRVRDVAFSPDGRLLATSDDRTVQLWDPATGEHRRTLTRTGQSVAFSPDGRVLASGHSRRVLLWDLATSEVIRDLRHTGVVRNVAFSPDGRLLAGAASDWKVRLWDPATGKHRHTLRHSPATRSKSRYPGVSGLAFSPDGRMLASGGDGTVKLWDWAAGEHRRTLTSTGQSVAFSPDGRVLASGHGRRVLLWDLATGQVNRDLDHIGAVRNVAFSPDGQLLASGGVRWVLLWDPATGELRRLLTGHPSTVGAVASSPDGRLLASGVARPVPLWDQATSVLRQLLTGYTSTVGAVAFSPDGRLLASGYDKTVWLWDLTAVGRLAARALPAGPLRARGGPAGRSSTSRDRALHFRTAGLRHTFAEDRYRDRKYRSAPSSWRPQRAAEARITAGLCASFDLGAITRCERWHSADLAPGGWAV
jgi:eukaryotic-like serine/threonine-protein kinase